MPVHQDLLLRSFGEGNLLLNNGYWAIFMRPQQVTLGSLILAYWDDEADQLGKVPAIAYQSMADLVCAIEHALTNLFGAEKFNYLALMMVDPQVHFHVIPRYSRAVSFCGGEYADDAWPKPPSLQSSLDLPLRTRHELFARLKNSLKN